MRRALIPLGLAVAACAPQPQDAGVTPAPPPRQATAEEAARAAFLARSIDLSVPPALRELAGGWVLRQLTDPASAQFRFDLTARQGADTAVCGAVNARDGAGAYSGFRRFMVVVRGIAVAEGWMQRADEVPLALIEGCDASHPDHPSYPVKALEPVKSE